VTPVRVRVEPLPDGSRRVSVACPCARLGRVAAVWEDPEDVIAELRERHQREARVCRHAWLPRSAS